MDEDPLAHMSQLPSETCTGLSPLNKIKFATIFVPPTNPAHTALFIFHLHDKVSFHPLGLRLKCRDGRATAAVKKIGASKKVCNTIFCLSSFQYIRPYGEIIIHSDSVAKAGMKMNQQHWPFMQSAPSSHPSVLKVHHCGKLCTCYPFC